eukprot:CAMPEP_0175026218 /NCGR_PEP_ID=MMETSP0005-20121125/17605_1 /TAXON_ID=420556 /ORGANISM="Ochromonas sp., Strain CCMP1393" /LENGTH=703 /DNA_ID=CAMNT_0016285267 /DNA_START=103 /DNA_END=2217 /DNA_ORIENTATION=+
MISKALEIISTCRKGHSVSARHCIKAGTTVVIEEPAACVPFPTSTLSSVQCHTGQFKYRSYEESLKTASNCEFSGYLKKISSANNAHIKLISKHVPVDCGSKESVENYGHKGLWECAEIMRHLLLQIDGVLNASVTTEACCETLCELMCNIYTLVDDFNVEAGLALYPFTSMINHSCVPNCVQRFDHTGRIIIRCMKDIQVHEELTVSYIDVGNPSWYRRRELLNTYYFLCDCPRCGEFDPLEGYKCNCVPVREGDSTCTVSSILAQPTATGSSSSRRDTGSSTAGKLGVVVVGDGCTGKPASKLKCGGICYPELCSGATAAQQYREWLSGKSTVTGSVEPHNEQYVPAGDSSYRFAAGARDIVDTIGADTIGADIGRKYIASTKNYRLSLRLPCEEYLVGSGVSSRPLSVLGQEPCARMNFKELLFTCSKCNHTFFGADVWSELEEVNALYRELPVPVEEVTTPSTSACSLVQSDAARLLYQTIHYCEGLLSKLGAIVPAHHYSLCSIRMHLKSVFEECLPVREGVLQFPPLRLRLPVDVNSVGDIETVPVPVKRSSSRSSSSSTGTSSNTSIPQHQTDIYMTPQQLQSSYQENFKALLEDIRCRYAVTSSSCSLHYTFHRLQYLWFLDNKRNSLLVRGTDKVPRNSDDWDVQYREEIIDFLREMPCLIKDIQNLYSSSHPFFIDVNGRYVDLQGIARASVH